VFLSFTHFTQATVPHQDAVAVLPLGAVETHGPHLPLGTDCLIADGILDRAAEIDKGGALILRMPAVWLGASGEHAEHPGTLTAEPEQVIDQIVNVGEGLVRCGILRMLLFNAHGGNIAAAAIAVMKLRQKFNMLAASVHWFDYGLPTGLVEPASAIEDVHGGWIETSMMLRLAPQLVLKSACAPRSPQTPAPALFPSGPVNWGWKIGDLAPQDANGGWIGRPDLATEELGQRLVDHAAQSVVKTLQELASVPWPPNR